jgi:MFS family permease
VGGSTSFAVVAGGLLSFFVAFNILEAMLPSLISRIAPPRAKGAALGVYNTTQAFGLFVGGALGGWLVEALRCRRRLPVRRGAAWWRDLAGAAALTMPPVPMRRALATAIARRMAYLKQNPEEEIDHGIGQ